MYYAVIHDTREGGKAMAVFPDKEDWEHAKGDKARKLQVPDNEEFVQLDWIDFVAKREKGDDPEPI